MSYFGQADFDRPIDFEGGRIYYPFGGGPFSLAPYRCSVVNVDDGRINFRLDLVRSASQQLGLNAYAVLELRLTADYAPDRALAYLRKDHPHAALSRCVLTDWAFRLAPGPVTANLPQEVLNATRLASNGLGSARMIMPLSIESGVLLENLVRDSQTPLPAIAEAQMVGVSPRVQAVVRFRTAALLGALASMQSADGTVPRQSLVDFFSRDPAGLPLNITGSIDADRRIAFGEALTDRVIDRFGAYALSSCDADEPLIQLALPDDVGQTDIIWSLSQSFLATRRIVLRFDLLADVRHRIQDGVDGSFVIRHTAAALPLLGESNLMVFCNLPTQRVGVAELGATLTFPPNPPNRPQARTVTVTFEPPDDIAQAQVRLAPGEALNYVYTSFAVIADELGVRQVDGPALSGSGSPLRLSPGDFPIDFGLIEVAPELAALATVTGTCRYDRDGKEYTIPFALDSGRLSASLALPKGQSPVNIQCTAISRSDGSKVDLGSFDSTQVRLNLSSFAAYGSHEVEIECQFDGRATLFAIDLLAEGDFDTFANITVLAFTPTQLKRRYAWFASSPFRPGFRYRPHQDNGNPGTWRSVSWPIERLTIQPERPRSQTASEAMSVSESARRELGITRTGRTSESARLAAGAFPEGLPTSPEPEPTDLLLYGHPSDPSKKLVVPRYALGAQTVSGRQEYRMAMTQQATKSTLTVHLTKGPRDAIADAARNAQEFPHEIAVRLEFLRSPPYTARKILQFQEVTRNGAEVMATMTFATLEERDEVYRALTDANQDARLIVERSIDVALPVLQVLGPSLRVPGNLHIILATKLPPRPKPIWVRPTVNTVNKALNVNLAATKFVAAGSEAAPVKVLANTSLVASLVGLNTRVAVADWFGEVAVASLPIPVLAFTGREDSAPTEGREPYVMCNLSITNWSDFSADFFQSSPDLPPCGRNTNASRTWVDILDAVNDARLYGFCALGSPNDLTHLWFATPPDKVPARVYVQLQDRRANVVRKSNVVDTTTVQPSTPTYVPAHRQLDNVVDPVPFAFLPSLHDYIFQGITPGSGDSRLVRFTVPWQSTFHTYLQDAARPEVVYYFPDEFRIARRAEAPFIPLITVRVTSHDGMADADVIFDYIVAPHIDLKRLQAASQALLADPSFGAAKVRFQPFITNDVRFFVDRPTPQGSKREERTGVSLVLQGALKDTLVMKVPDFQLLFDAMQRDTTSLFLGHVAIAVPGENPAIIQFLARMTALEGELFLYTASTDANGNLSVALTNAIESPLRINGLGASVSRDGQTASASIQGLTLPVPSLASGSAVQMTVVPTTPLGGSGTPQVAFDLDGVTVLPDAAAILDSILDRSTLQYYDIITVKTIVNLFDPIADRPNDQIVVILVEFQGGGTAELTANILGAQVRVDYPIDDVILRRAVDTSYRYTVTVIRANGRQEQDVTPRQGTARILFVSVVK